MRLNRIVYSFIAFATIVLFSCHEERFPHQLVVADSLIGKGKYELATQQIEAYSHKNTLESTHITNYTALLRFKLKFLEGTISMYDFELLDSLEKYYQSKSSKEGLCWLLLCKSEIFRNIQNDSLALDYALKAENTAQDICNHVLEELIQECIGDIYFQQGMHAECIKHYKKFYEIADKYNDSLRVAYASLRMGSVYTIENKVDSIIYYLEKASYMASGFPQSADIRQTALFRLADIYIQTEDFGKAYNVMSRDSTNTANWAYWHYGQGHLDSATFYFEKFLQHPSLSIQAEGLHNLVEISKQTNDEHQLALYSSKLIEVNDSIKKHSQREKIKQSEMQHAIESIVSNNKKQAIASFIIISVIAILWTTSIVAIFYYRKKNRKLEDSNDYGIDTEFPQISDKNDILSNSAIYNYITLNAGKDDFRLTESQWQELRELIDIVYEGFTNKMLKMGIVSETELRVCYLIKLRIQPSKIATAIHKSRSGITMLRRRMYKKITGANGTTQQFDELIMNQ